MPKKITPKKTTVLNKLEELYKVKISELEDKVEYLEQKNEGLKEDLEKERQNAIYKRDQKNNLIKVLFQISKPNVWNYGHDTKIEVTWAEIYAEIGELLYIRKQKERENNGIDTWKELPDHSNDKVTC